MKNITMLMTGVLMTERLYLLNLLNLYGIQQDKDMQKLMHNYSYQLISKTKAQSSKDNGLSNNLKIVPFAIESRLQRSKIARGRQIFTKKINNLPELNSSQNVNNTFYKKRNLIAKQNRSNIVSTKFQKAIYINRQNLINEENNNDIFVASYQNFTNQRLPNLGFSSSGVAVRVLQRLLVANGYPIKIDGHFGALTESAVKAFQDRQNLIVDGIVGTQTWYSLTMYSKYSTMI
ncbi:hypothetical protein NIES2111_25480 [Nostoc sp. NIES-2111]|nr:hypothetical protein NIES2111_25480 [Nostoc sp. NIES-2111]